jgi:integrase
VAALPKIIDLSPPGHKPQSLVLLLRERRDGRNSQYYARRIVPLRLRKTPRNPYATKALGPVSLERAKELAWQWWTSGEPPTHGKGSPDGHRFEKVARAFLADLKTKQETVNGAHPAIVSLKKYARHDQSIRLHLNPFFGSLGIENIGPEDVERWLEWRLSPPAPDGKEDPDRTDLATESKTYSPPARSTVQKDAVAFAAVLRHARLRFKVDTRFVPELPLPAQTEDTRRPRFYPDEWQRLSQALADRGGTRKGKRGPLSQNSIWFRAMLFFFVITLHGTGLRVAEAMRLQVKHLRRVPEDAARLEAYRKEMGLRAIANESEASRTERERNLDAVISRAYDYRVVVASSNQLKHYTHQRIVIPTVDMTARFDQMLMRLNATFSEQIDGFILHDLLDHVSPDLWLFCHPDGKRIKSFDHGFDEVLEELGLLYHDGKRRSLTSIRHTYASERIEARKADLKSIADNMGTTIDMLNKHYAQEIRELRAADLQVV